MVCRIPGHPDARPLRDPDDVQSIPEPAEPRTDADDSSYRGDWRGAAVDAPGAISRVHDVAVVVLRISAARHGIVPAPGGDGQTTTRASAGAVERLEEFPFVRSVRLEPSFSRT